MRSARIFVFLFVFLCFGLSDVEAQDGPGNGKSSLAPEITALAASIDRLARALEADDGKSEQDMLFRKLNLAIAYLNFRSRRIEMLEQDLQEARTSKDQIESTLNVWLQQREDLDNEDSSLPTEETRQRREELKVRIDLVKSRVSQIDSDIVNLENKIYQLQDQIDSVEEFVQNNLAL